MMLDAGTWPFVAWFGALALGCAGLYMRNGSEAGETKPAEFTNFQRLFLVVYLLMMCVHRDGRLGGARCDAEHDDAEHDDAASERLMRRCSAGAGRAQYDSRTCLSMRLVATGGADEQPAGFCW